MTVAITADGVQEKFIAVAEGICPVELAEQIKRVEARTAEEAFQLLAGVHEQQQGRPDPSGLFFHLWEPVEQEGPLSLLVELSNCLLFSGPMDEFNTAILTPASHN